MNMQQSARQPFSIEWPAVAPDWHPSAHATPHLHRLRLRTLIPSGRTGTSSSPFRTLRTCTHPPKNHLTKVVHHLGQLGLVTTIRGRSGGLKLGREPQTINVVPVVRVTETGFPTWPNAVGMTNQCVCLILQA